MSKELAENAMNATVQCLYLVVDKSIADDVFGRWISYKIEVKATIQQLEARVKELEAMAQPCRWTLDLIVGQVWETSCGEAFCIEADGPVENKMKWCCYCGGKMEIGNDKA